MVSGGVKENVVPQEARGSVNFRILPCESTDDVLAHVRTTIDDPEIEIESGSWNEAARPGRVVANRPVPKRMTTQPPSPQQQREVERKVMRLAMRTQPDLPRSQLEQHDSGDEPAKTETPPDKAPKGPKMPDQKEASPRKRVTMRDLQLSDKELRALTDYMLSLK